MTLHDDFNYTNKYYYNKFVTKKIMKYFSKILTNSFLKNTDKMSDISTIDNKENKI